MPPLISREIELTDGAVFLSQMPSFINLSLISQENIPGFCLFSSSILFSTSGVATLGFEPPITPGRIEPVSYEEKMYVNKNIYFLATPTCIYKEGYTFTEERSL